MTQQDRAALRDFFLATDDRLAQMEAQIERMIALLDRLQQYYDADARADTSKPPRGGPRIHDA